MSADAMRVFQFDEKSLKKNLTTQNYGISVHNFFLIHGWIRTNFYMDPQAREGRTTDRNTVLSSSQRLFITFSILGK
jgi:hypothetical protein